MTTSVRASMPMYFVESDYGFVKVVLSGEGADEIFGGYLYFRNASAEDFQKETIERAEIIYRRFVKSG
jgi:asparagine synthase (glutamine-hydrolysing)